MVNYKKEFEDFFNLENTFRPLEKNFYKLKDKKIPLYQTGLSFIDEPLRGIMETETILIGADSGYGKTELASILSMNIAAQGVKTLFIALECYDGEIEDRRKFPQISSKVWKEKQEVIYQKDWICGLYPEYEHYEKEIILDDNLKGNLFIRYRMNGEDYTEKTLTSDLDKVLKRKEIKFCIIDHIHHFDMENVYSENIEMKNLIKKICNMSQMHHVPIIIFGQFKKKNMSNSTLVPDYDEFFGTSELYKNVSAVITMAPDFEAEANELEFPTLFRICKGRGGTQLKKYAFGAIYDAINKCYKKDYYLYQLLKGGTKKEDVTRRPSWCKSYILPKLKTNVGSWRSNND